jgi:VIT1/CCC1 family predicted Fe2+/Mn2+ transporter
MPSTAVSRAPSSASLVFGLTEIGEANSVPRYDVILRNGGERGAEYDSGAASVVAGDEIEIEGELWRVESVEVEKDAERLVCVLAPREA